MANQDIGHKSSFVFTRVITYAKYNQDFSYEWKQFIPAIAF